MTQARGDTSETRQARGQTAYHSGLAAESQVSQHYEDAGHELVECRWRGDGGEIDLVMRNGDEIIFVEVKRARSLHDAAFRLSTRQLRRLHAAAEEYLATHPSGPLTPARLDLALVGGAGEIEIIENVVSV